MSDPYAVTPAAPAPSPPAPPRSGPAEPSRVRRKAAWALALSILGNVVLLGVGGIVALLLGHSALADAKRLQAPVPGVRGLAVTAIVLGWVGIVVGMLALAYLAWVVLQLASLPYASS